VHTRALCHELHEAYIPACGAPDPDPILILGEKGTGKDLIARYIHAYSKRQHGAFIAVNCAEITDELASARFFGHKRGSFTGSVSSEPGFFRVADRGILFLDEIAELSIRAQGTLLRVLENRTILPVGETRESRVDVQVILATNRDPEKAVAEGVLRPDLYDRFRTHAIRLAPLRERPWDIPALVRHYIGFHEGRMQRKTLGVTLDALRTMVGYVWPGNVRELARVCSMLVIRAQPGTVIAQSLLSRYAPEVQYGDRNPKSIAVSMDDLPMRDAVRIIEREIIVARLRQHNWNIRSARESLALPKTTFNRYTRGLGIAITPRRNNDALDGMAEVEGSAR